MHRRGQGQQRRDVVDAKLGLMSKLHARTEYDKGSLRLEDVTGGPWSLLDTWLQDAVNAGLPDPTAMALSTLDEHGFPHSRIVLLRSTESGGLVFFTNYQSEKGRDLARNAKAGATFFWPQLERQVRVRGEVRKISAEASDAYFASRPRASQVGAWASNQSEPVRPGTTLEDAYSRALLRFQSEDVVPRPPHWGGYELVPVQMEFWQGRPSRMHHRVAFTCPEGSEGWAMCQLQP